MKFAPYINDLFYRIQFSLQPSISVEVGAYDADFSYKMARTAPSVRPFAFEANRHNVEKFMADSRWYGVDYIYSAVTDYVGEVPFFFQSNSRLDVGNNSILDRIEEDTHTELVPCTTLDHFFFGEGRASESDSFCLWIDVEGATGKVFQGASQTLAQTSSILVEVEHKKFWDGQWMAEDVIKFLQSQGFSLLARDFEYYPTQENFLFVRV